MFATGRVERGAARRREMRKTTKKTHVCSERGNAALVRQRRMRRSRWGDPRRERPKDEDDKTNVVQKHSQQHPRGSGSNVKQWKGWMITCHKGDIPSWRGSRHLFCSSGPLRSSVCGFLSARLAGEHITGKQFGLWPRCLQRAGKHFERLCFLSVRDAGITGSWIFSLFPVSGYGAWRRAFQHSCDFTV